VHLNLGITSTSPVTGKPVAGEAVPKSKPEDVATAKKVEPTPPTVHKFIPETTNMSYSVDPAASSFTVKITNNTTGEVIRKLNFKEFSPSAHSTDKLAGKLVDVKI
jgi:uncharacterized FlaG/YvyC family protein